MREVFIKYNPYRLETEILVDGESPKANSRLQVGERRLQEWIEELPTILLDEHSTNNFNLTFYGTTLDYEDVQEVVQKARKNGITINIKEHIKAKETSEKEAAITEIFEKIQNGPFDELKQPDVIKAFNLARSSEFEVNVIATMSAGKSTLINSLLGQKLMPSKNEACTAIITEIKDNDSDHFNADVYDISGNLFETHKNLDLGIMTRLNSNPQVARIRTEGNIPFVTADDTALVLVDTPGPNNSRDPEHKATTYRMLSDSSKALVLYVMNATQTGTNDDSNLLNDVAEKMSNGGKQSRDRFIFVVNKIDTFNKKDGDDVASTISKIREYLKEKGIENPNIYPASALTALNIRTLLGSDADEDDDDVYETRGKIRKFNNKEEMHLEQYAPLTPSTRAEIENKLAELKESGNSEQEALIHCGIVPIETAIKTYVKKYAKTAKIKNVVDTFLHRLESAKSFETIKKDIAENTDKHEEIMATIDKLNAKLASGEEAKKFKSKIEDICFDDEIEKVVKNVKKKYQNRLTDKLTMYSGNVSEDEAHQIANRFKDFADSLQAELQVELEDIIDVFLIKSSNKLLTEYKNKLNSFEDDIKVGSINIKPLEIMNGNINLNVNSMIQSSTKTETVKVGEKWVKNNDKKWYKPWTWFDEKGWYVDVTEERNFVDAVVLTQKFAAPVQESLIENTESAISYADQQTVLLKKDFIAEFDKLDEILKLKLQELKEAVNDSDDLDEKIKKSQSKLDWLQNIKHEIDDVLNI